MEGLPSLNLRICNVHTSHVSMAHSSSYAPKVWLQGPKLRFEQMSPQTGDALGQQHLLYCSHTGTSTASRSWSFPISLKGSHGFYLYFMGREPRKAEWVSPMGDELKPYIF